MDKVLQVYAQFLLYLIAGSFWVMFLLTLAGWLIAGAIYFWYRSLRVSREAIVRQPRAWVKWVYMALALVALLGVFVVSGKAGAGDYVSLLFVGLGLGLLYYFWFHWLIIFPAIVVVSLMGALAWFLISDFSAVSGSRSLVLTMHIRGREFLDNDERISLTYAKPNGKESDTVYVHGNQWGVRLDVVTFKSGIPLLGGKRYVRPSASLGAKNAQLDFHYFNDITQPMWNEFLAEAKLPGVASIVPSMRFFDPDVGADYDLYLTDKGEFQVEQQGNTSAPPATSTTNP